MTKQPEQIEDTNGRVTLNRGVVFKLSPTESLTGDRVTAEYSNGDVEDVAIVDIAGQRRARLLAENMSVPTGQGFFAFRDVDAATEKRLLALHKMFPAA